MNKITKNLPSGILNHLQHDINRLFEPFGWITKGTVSDVFTSDWSPNVDVMDEPHAYIIHADLPGVDPKDIEIHMENGVLTMKGHKAIQKEEKSDKFVRIERSKGSFIRQFTLPESADAQNIKAKTKRGVLEIIIPKTTSAKAHRIQIDEEQE